MEKTALTYTHATTHTHIEEIREWEKNWRKMGIKLFYDFVREQHIAILWTHLWLWKQDGNGLRGSFG